MVQTEIVNDALYLTAILHIECMHNQMPSHRITVQVVEEKNNSKCKSPGNLIREPEKKLRYHSVCYLSVIPESLVQYSDENMICKTVPFILWPPSAYAAIRDTWYVTHAAKIYLCLLINCESDYTYLMFGLQNIIPSPVRLFRTKQIALLFIIWSLYGIMHCWLEYRRNEWQTAVNPVDFVCYISLMHAAISMSCWEMHQPCYKTCP